MSRNEQGMILPFRLTGSRLRRAAQEYSRRGQIPQALTLLRRAAEQEDTAADWQALAGELMQAGCWEAASVLLGRVLSREGHALAAWLLMARCQRALGQDGLAMDCLYHLLQTDPWAKEADAARALLQEMDMASQSDEPVRLSKLIHRGMQAWRQGDRELGLRRMKRALRLTEHKARQMSAIAMLYVTEGEYRPALAWLLRALRCEPRDVNVLCTLAALLCQLGREDSAMVYLQIAARQSMDLRMEDRFATVAWAMSAWPVLEKFLQKRLKRRPYRVPLLNAKAAMLHERGDRAGARAIWRQALEIDPDDRWAHAMLVCSKAEPQSVPLGRLPEYVMALHRYQVQHCEREALLRPGSESRRIMDWFAASEEPEEQVIALGMAELQPDTEAEQRFLRELLTRPEVPENMRQKALGRLAAMKYAGPLPLLLGNRYVTAQCQMSAQSASRGLWRKFLPALLRASGAAGRARETVTLAAELWPELTPETKRAAALTDSEEWARVFTALSLLGEGDEAQAERIIRCSALPARRLRRMLDTLSHAIENSTGEAGEGDTSS